MSALAAEQIHTTGEIPAERPITLGVIVGNRGFFPHHLAASGRKQILEALARARINAVIPEEGETDHGAIESLAESRICADAFRRNRDAIDGVLVTLPNFGDERAVANVLRMADLDVPVLVHAFPDDPIAMSVENRRDSFCGKLSVCNNLHQYGIPFSLTSRHTEAPDSPEFADDLKMFAGTCRIVRGLRGMRVGMMGARPAAFNTVRFSEKILETNGISTETLDLSEAFGRVERLNDDDPDVISKRQSIERYADARGVPASALSKMARFGVVLDRWVSDAALDATAIQCWTSMEQYFGITPCTLMSMSSNSLMSSACETDIAGVIGMQVLALASGRPSALYDWNNNYGDDPDKAVVFHCSNLPKDVFVEILPKIDYQAILAGSLGPENTYGSINGRVREDPFTFLRVSTDDVHGEMRAYVGEGVFTDDPLDTFGGYGVARVPRLQELMRHICEYGFEHHMAAGQSLVAASVEEALNKYMGWSVYRHS